MLIHLQQNANAYLPIQSTRLKVAADIRLKFYVHDQKNAEGLFKLPFSSKYFLLQVYQEGLKKTIRKVASFFDFPCGYRKKDSYNKQFGEVA